MRRHRTASPSATPLFAALVVAAAACTSPVEPPLGEPDEPGEAPGRPEPEPTDPTTDAPPVPPANLSTTCPVEGTSAAMSLAITDPAVLARFPFARTIAQIRATAAVPGTMTTRTLWRDWMRSFSASTAAGDCDDLDRNGYGLRCPRPAEAKLAAVDPLAIGAGVRFEPVGIFNRFDLAPGNGAHCGEYRIVYAMRSERDDVRGRAFLIFEGALANPTPRAGVAACLPVARFWQALSADGDPASRAGKLERFFYLGTAVPGFGAVVRAQGYGLASGAGSHGFGQIRGNFFIDDVEWQLREYKLRRTCAVASDPATCRLAAQLVPAKANPAEELFRGTHPRSAAFQTAFVSQVVRLIGNDVNALALTTADGFNELESVSTIAPGLPAPTRYDVHASTAMRSAITARLGQLGSSLTSGQVLARAATQTCAGCHQVAANLNLGGGLRWPQSLEFVHIDEDRRLSPALTGSFLPRRLQVLEGFINARCAPPGGVARGAPLAIPDGLTVGGQPVGAAN